MHQNLKCIVSKISKPVIRGSLRPSRAPRSSSSSNGGSRYGIHSPSVDPVFQFSSLDSLNRSLLFLDIATVIMIERDGDLSSSL